jgi:formimidoylglutamate deiminase
MPPDGPPAKAALYRADAVISGGSVTRDALLAVDAAGDVIEAEGRPEAAERIAGIVVPGVPNVHSHAFQRAMAGLAERAGPEGDNFWAWREVMYRFLEALTPEDVEAIAAQLYVECLKHGFTTVGEFHYLHTAPDGALYDDPAELSQRILAAAETAGIGLTLMPVLYQASQLGGAPPTEGQRRFILSDEDFAGLMQAVAKRMSPNPNWRLGVAPHSLRAVAPEALDRAVSVGRSLDPAMPVHIHAAEQVKEVEDCLAWSGKRPVEWLLDHGAGSGWCLIHCTHMTEGERRRLAASGAVAGLCPTTEANLGDGFFAIRDFVAEGGAFGVGTDSNVSTSPVEELRWLEYGCRLQRRARNVAETRVGASVGQSLMRRALAGGAAALGRPIGSLGAGHRADLVVLDPGHPALIGRPPERILDALVFNGNDTPVRDVMVGGRWVVRDRVHVAEAPVKAAFAKTMKRLEERL